jgi:hypothetical protein
MSKEPSSSEASKHFHDIILGNNKCESKIIITLAAHAAASAKMDLDRCEIRVQLNIILGQNF